MEAQAALIALVCWVMALLQGAPRAPEVLELGVVGVGRAAWGRSLGRVAGLGQHVAPCSHCSEAPMGPWPHGPMLCGQTVLGFWSRSLGRGCHLTKGFDIKLAGAEERLIAARHSAKPIPVCRQVVLCCSEGKGGSQAGAGTVWVKSSPLSISRWS